MSRDGSITLPFADGDKTFRLAWGQLVKLQEATDAGPFVVYRRLMAGGWKMEDISHTIRLGLIGGGMTPEKALTFVRDYVESRPPMESLALAQGILGTAIQGAPDEKPGESEGETTDNGSTTSPTANGE
jgi:hypothetical protein